MTTKRPVRVRCAVQGCQQEKYLHQMAQTPVWEIRSHSDFTCTQVYATWCYSCERKRMAKANETLRKEVAVLREAFYEKLAGAETRVCRQCKVERPETLFLARLRQSGKEVSRLSTCVRCQHTVSNHARVRGKQATRNFTGIAPFDMALGVVEKKIGRKIEHWGRQEHNVHCILMREFAGLSQSRAAYIQGHQARESADFLEQERVKWDRIVTNVYGWAGLPLPERLQVQAP